MIDMAKHRHTNPDGTVTIVEGIEAPPDPPPTVEDLQAQIDTLTALLAGGE